MTKTKYRPFSNTTVKGIREGKISRFSLLLKPQPWYGSQVPGGPHFIWTRGSGQRFNATKSNDGSYYVIHSDYFLSEVKRKQPYQVGDVIGVKESWFKTLNHGFVYKADGYDHTKSVYYTPELVKWRSPISMPNEACRTFLKVTGVKVQRVKETNYVDSNKEGLSISMRFSLSVISSMMSKWLIKSYGQSAYDSNAWIVAYEFELTEKPQ